MMITCWIGVVGDLANAGAIVSAQSALVATHSDLNGDSRVMKSSPVKACEVPGAGAERALSRNGSDRRPVAPSNIGRHNLTPMSSGTQFYEKPSTNRQQSGVEPKNVRKQVR